MGKGGLKSVFQSATGSLSALASLPKTMITLMIVGFSVLMLVIVVVVGVGAWGVGSGNIDVNELAKTGADVAKSVPIIPV